VFASKATPRAEEDEEARAERPRRVSMRVIMGSLGDSRRTSARKLGVLGEEPKAGWSSLRFQTSEILPR
jgi:hypothetical protein